MEDKLIVVSSDSHAGVPKELWAHYLPERYHELLPQLRRDNEIEMHATEVTNLQKEIDSKVSEISGEVLLEEEASRSGGLPPPRQGGLEAVELKCPNCGAKLPMPTGRFVKCEYCETTLSIQDMSSQIREMIQSI